MPLCIEKTAIAQDIDDQLTADESISNIIFTGHSIKALVVSSPQMSWSSISQDLSGRRKRQPKKRHANHRRHGHPWPRKPLSHDGNPRPRRCLSGHFLPYNKTSGRIRQTISCSGLASSGNLQSPGGCVNLEITDLRPWIQPSCRRLPVLPNAPRHDLQAVGSRTNRIGRWQIQGGGMV